MILAVGKPEVTGNQIWAVGGLTDLGDVMLCQKSLHESCRMGRCIVVMKLIRSLSHCECDGHTVHKFSQRLLTADWLAPWASDCSWMHSKVFSDWLPSYMKAMWPVLEIFKMDGFFPDSPREYVWFVIQTPTQRQISWWFHNPTFFHTEVNQGKNRQKFVNLVSVNWVHIQFPLLFVAECSHIAGKWTYGLWAACLLRWWVVTHCFLVTQTLTSCIRLPNYWVNISKSLLSLILRPQKEVPWMVGMMAFSQNMYRYWILSPPV